MAAETIVAGAGSLLQLSISSVYTNIGQQVSLDGPEMAVGTVETSNLATTTGKTYRPTIFDGGEMSGTLQYDPKGATHIAVNALLTTVPPVAGLWKLILSSGSVFAFTGILTKLKPTGIELETNVEAEFTIKISGAVAITP